MESEALRQPHLLTSRADRALDGPGAGWVAPFVVCEGPSVAHPDGLGQQVSHLLGDRDRRAALLRLQRLVPPLHRWRYKPGREIDVLDPQRRCLREPQPRMGPKKDGRPHPGWHGVVQRPDLLGRCDVRPLLAHARRRASRARVSRHDPVVDRVGEQLRQPGVERIDIGVGAPLVLECRRPGAHVRRPDGRHRYRIEVCLDDLDVDLSLAHSRPTPRSVAREPFVAPLPDRQLRVLRRDVVTTEERGDLRVEPLLGIDLPVEGTGVLAPGVVDVPCPPTPTLPETGDGTSIVVPFASLTRLRQRSSTEPRWFRRCLGLGCLLMDSP